MSKYLTDEEITEAITQGRTDFMKGRRSLCRAIDDYRAIANAASDARAEYERGRILERLNVSGVFGHQHWDSKGTCGANCPICQAQREFREWLESEGK